MSPCSSSCACGMISLSTKLLTVDRISRWMSVRSAVCAKRVNGLLLRDCSVLGYSRVCGTADGASACACSLTTADRGGVPPDRRPLDGKGPMSTSDENLYRGDPPASAPPPAGPPQGYGPPPAYGQPALRPPPGYGPPPGYPMAYPRPTNTMAILALVLAFVFAPAGLILGIVARKQIRQTGEEGDGLALAGIIVGGIFTALFALMIIFFIVAVSTATSFGP